MKTKKGIFKLFIYLVIIAIISIILYSYYNKNNITGRKNWYNIEKLKIGMTMSNVESIMGEPDTIYFIDDKKSQYRGHKSFYYTTGNNPGRFEVIFDKNVDTVIYIHISFK